MLPRLNSNSIQEWLEGYNSAIKVAKTAFPPRDSAGKANRINVPFIIYLDDVEPEGGDYNNMARLHDLTIEYYSDDGADSDFEAWLYATGLKYSYDQSYVQQEQLFLSTFSIDEILIEKE